jgi:erythromycin esterase
MRDPLAKPTNSNPGYRDIVLPRLSFSPETCAATLRSHMIPLSSLQVDFWLKDFLQDTRLLGIGDGSHGTIEFFKVQETVTRRLIELHNVRLVFFEVPTPFCHVVNQRLGSKEGGNIDELVMLACQFDTWTNPPIVNLLRFIGDWNRRNPEDQVKVRGIDPQLGGSLERLMESLTLHTPYLDDIRSWCRDLSCLYLNRIQENPKHASRRDSNAHSRSQTEDLRRNIKKLGRDLLVRGKTLLSLCAEQESTSYLIRSTYLELAFQVRSIGRDHLGRSDNRDKYMAASVMREVNNLHSEQRAAILAHNSHVSYGQPGLFSNGMGCFLKRAYSNGAYKVIVNTSAGGTFTSRANDTSWERQLFISEPAPLESLEGVLRLAADGPSILDIQRAARDPRLNHIFSSLIAFRSVGCIVYKCEFVPLRPADQFDAVIFFPESNGI